MFNFIFYIFFIYKIRWHFINTPCNKFIFIYAKIENADFTRADLRRSWSYPAISLQNLLTFDHAVLLEVNFTLADLYRTSFANSKITGVNFTGAILERADFRRSVFQGVVNFTGAIVIYADFRTVSGFTPKVNFTNANVSYADFRNVKNNDWKLSNFTGAFGLDYINK